MPGLFISFEGGEGSGKSTQVGLLAESLRAQGYPLTVTREPGGTPLGHVLRHLLLEQKTSPLAAGTEVLLLLADRAQHIQEVIAPGLAANHIVICDRYIDSTTAYQGYGRGIDHELLQTLNQFVCKAYLPTLTFLLDLPVEKGLSRAAQRRSSEEGADHFEAESVAFHERVRAGFLQLAQECPQRIHVIDTTRSKEVVRQEIFHIVSSRLPPKEKPANSKEN